jgi:light-regulated signal transduction histidine kinase (bacteriophytochrome)
METSTTISEITAATTQPVVADNYKTEYAEFIDLATHDLDAPLRKLSMLVELLSDKLGNIVEDNDVQPYIKRIETCVNDMRMTIDDLSMLSKINGEKRKHVSCDLQTIVQHAIEELQPVIKQKKAVITVSALPLITGNTEQLEKLFKNLIENAIKFSKKDVTPCIKISSLQLNRDEIKKLGLPENNYYKIEVSDNGIGFSQEYAEKIFRPFYRLHGKSKYSGTGIGLAACKKVVENHKGMIYATSRENSGSCFVIILAQTTNF